MNNKSKIDHFYLVDGSGYIFRAYYALPPLSRKSDGLPTGAVNGFCKMLFDLLEEVRSDDSKNKPTHFAIVFDSARKNFRNDIYPDYKANRSETPEDLIPQFDYIRKSVDAFNLPSIEMLNYEADDLIATYAEKIIKDGNKATIVSSDKDFMQLVKPGIRLYDPIKNKEIGLNEVKEKFGVKPNQVIDVQSLAGDSSDNVPGVPGIGIKTASELINQYDNLENLLKNVEKIKQNKRRQTLTENQDKAILSKKLVTLKNNVPIKISLESLKIKSIAQEKLYSFLREMEFNRLLSQAIAYYGEPNKDKTNITKSNSQIDRKKYVQIKEIKELDIWLNKCEEKGIVAVDTETNSLDPINANLVGISLCVAPNEACYIPLLLDGKNFLNTKKVLEKIKPVMEDKSIKKIGQNIKYDWIIFLRNGIKLNPVEDTMLMSYTLDAGNNRHGMDMLSEIHLGHKSLTFKDVAGIGKKQVTFDKVPLKIATEYAAEDADITFRLYEIFKKRISNEKLIKIYESFEKPMIEILAKMEICGIKINSNFLKKLSINFEKKINELENKIFKISNKKFNIASTKQLGEILYNELKIGSLKKTKKGSFATSAAILEDLAFKGHEVPKLVLDWRQISKLKNTYTDALPNHINKISGRVHTSFLLAATSTGRLASSDPNLQNIPIKNDEGREIRKAFIAENNCSLISADYNQIEMRILADIADVKELKKAFKNNEDIHSLTASQVFNIPISKVDEDMRRKAKSINFGIIYGISQYGLAKQISVSNNEAKDFLDLYFKKFPEIKDYMKSTVNFCRKNGYVINVFGRRCYLRGINDKNFNVRSFQERAAINAPIQGTAADVMRLAMMDIFQYINKENLTNLKMMLQIHDELIFEVLDKDSQTVSKFIKKIMSDVSSNEFYNFSVPLTVDINVGKNWEEAH
jgi:DNA polymerase-1